MLWASIQTRSVIEVVTRESISFNLPSPSDPLGLLLYKENFNFLIHHFLSCDF